MKTILLFLFLFLVISVVGPGQTQIENSDKRERIRLKVGSGFALFTVKKRFENHFDRYNYGHDYEHILPAITVDFSDISIPLFLDIGLGYRINQRVWIDLLLSLDNKVFYRKANFNNTAVFSRMHRSRFISPQVTYNVPDSKFGFFGGPTLDFHTTGSGNYTLDLEEKHVKPGALIGTLFHADNEFKLFIAYRWTADLSFETQVDTYQGFTYKLPSQEVGFGYLRLGGWWNILFKK